MKMADCRVEQMPGQVLATYGLGSCIALAAYDPVAGVGGLLHFMLPDSGIDPARGRNNPYMFADTGIPLLLSQVCQRGASKRRLVVHAVGGGQMADTGNIFDIGKRNCVATRKILGKQGVRLSGEVVGGDLSRTLRLEIGTGRLLLQEGGEQREIVPAQPRK